MPTPHIRLNPLQLLALKNSSSLRAGMTILTMRVIEISLPLAEAMK